MMKQIHINRNPCIKHSLLLPVQNIETFCKNTDYRTIIPKTHIKDEFYYKPTSLKENAQTNPPHQSEITTCSTRRKVKYLTYLEYVLLNNLHSQTQHL